MWNYAHFLGQIGGSLWIFLGGFLDSSRCRAQNDGIGLDCHDSALPNLAMTNYLPRHCEEAKLPKQSTKKIR